MSASPPLLTVSYSIGRYRATFTLPAVVRAGAVGSLLVEWEPDRPTDLTPAEHAEYRLARDSFLREALRLIGGSRALVVS